ncbi:thioesterase family protein [Staphylococcus durrellii]|uniref:thioesterase family protein n=1 Tax=Staphylococcus durrellii TaxID=2781773 RepID=UPI0018A0B0CB|nr:thioesterase family protein [Staphylococcus durrellii]MBF7016292.1 thioesterase family protein [Staphylococcus durrellii]
MTHALYQYQTNVKVDWVDHNNHMNDAAYNRVFSDATDGWLAYLGLDKDTIENLAYTVFTLENHVMFLKELKVYDQVTVNVSLIDYDEKRLHCFMTLLNKDEVKCATYEVMLMGMDTNKQRPSEFPKKIKTAINDYANIVCDSDSASELGHKIEIKRK